MGGVVKMVALGWTMVCLSVAVVALVVYWLERR
nr:MAG TPA: toxin [Caudoviricetes sp.]